MFINIDVPLTKSCKILLVLGSKTFRRCFFYFSLLKYETIDEAERRDKVGGSVALILPSVCRKTTVDMYQFVTTNFLFVCTERKNSLPVYAIACFEIQCLHRALLAVVNNFYTDI